jgi:hypothetical protein
MGRKMIMMIGMLAAVLLYRPIYRQMFDTADIKTRKEIPALKTISKTSTPGKNDLVSVVQTESHFEGGNKLIERATYHGAADVPTETKKEIVLGNENFWMMVVLVLIQVVMVTMVYGPIAAFLVELFPTRIRYTSMSLPYHIGNGIFGGLTPFIATSLYESSKSASNPAGDPFAGLWYPIIVAAVCFVIGMIFLSNKRKAEVLD